MKHLLDTWPGIKERLQKARGILLLSDFDGTLSPIAETPEAAFLPEPTRRLLEELTRQRGIKVGIISGRSLEDLKEKVNIYGLIYAGNHGFEIEGPGLRFKNPAAAEMRPFIRAAHHRLSQALGSVTGVRIEDKGVTLSIHYRQVQEGDVPYVKEAIQQALRGPITMGMVKITTGKMVYEVRPAVEWDKGQAIRFLIKKYGEEGVAGDLFPIYMGDDQTDEDGFRAVLNHSHGAAVYIGEPEVESAASYFLRSPDEVQIFLSLLAEYARKNFPGPVAGSHTREPARAVHEGLPAGTSE